MNNLLEAFAFMAIGMGLQDLGLEHPAFFMGVGFLFAILWPAVEEWRTGTKKQFTGE